MQSDFPTPEAEPVPEGYKALSSVDVARLFAIASSTAAQEPAEPVYDVEVLLIGCAVVVGVFMF